MCGIAIKSWSMPNYIGVTLAQSFLRFRMVEFESLLEVLADTRRSIFKAGHAIDVTCYQDGLIICNDACQLLSLRVWQCERLRTDTEDASAACRRECGPAKDLTAG